MHQIVVTRWENGPDPYLKVPMKIVDGMKAADELGMAYTVNRIPVKMMTEDKTVFGAQWTLSIKGAKPKLLSDVKPPLEFVASLGNTNFAPDGKPTVTLPMVGHK